MGGVTPLVSVCSCRFAVMNFTTLQAANQASDNLKTIREDLTVSTEDGATFPSKLISSR